jgi:hypothetical protein
MQAARREWQETHVAAHAVSFSQQRRHNASEDARCARSLDDSGEASVISVERQLQA